MADGVVQLTFSEDMFGDLQIHSVPEFLDTSMCMDDPRCVVQTCFFGGPMEYPITMNENYPIIMKPAFLTSVCGLRRRASSGNVCLD